MIGAGNISFDLPLSGRSARRWWRKVMYSAYGTCEERYRLEEGGGADEWGDSLEGTAVVGSDWR